MASTASKGPQQIFHYAQIEVETKPGVQRMWHMCCLQLD